MSAEIPPGFSPALHPITNRDHGGYATIASGCGLVFILLFAVIRLFNCHRIGFYPADHFLFAGTAIAVVQSILIFVAVDEGFGKYDSLLQPAATQRVAKMIYTSEILYVIAMFLSKLSLIMLQWRLSIEKRHVIFAKGSFGFTCVALIAGFFMIALGGDVSQPWSQITDGSGSIFPQWAAVEILGMAAEVPIFLLIARLYFNLQRGWKGKVKGLSVFGLRLGLITFAVLRLLSLKESSGSSNAFFRRIPVVAWTQTELSYSLATATLPCLMIVMMKWNSAFGAFSPETVIEQSQQDSRNITGGSYELRSIPRSQKGATANTLRTDEADHRWTIHQRPAEARSTRSDDSTNMIIRKTVEFSCEQEQ